MPHHSSEFPYLGVTVKPHKGGALRWTCKNEKNVKVDRVAHQETFDFQDRAIVEDGEYDESKCRVVLTAYIKS